MDPTILLASSTTILTVVLVALLIIKASKNGHQRTGKKVKHDLHKIKEQINGQHDEETNFIPKPKE